jgi:cyclase
MLAKRIIPCLDVMNGKVVKGVRFRDHKVVGEIQDLALYYRDQGADEIVFYDISASPEGRIVDLAWIGRVAHFLDVPFCVAGGIRSRSEARQILNEGADKVSINSPALERPELITELAAEFGRQAVVVGIDSYRSQDGVGHVQMYTGNERKSKAANRSTLAWVQEVQERGAGEIVLNCMNRDGTGDGYDVGQVAAVRDVCRVPLVASGGARSAHHFAAVFKQAGADAALAARAFHDKVLMIPALKQNLFACGVEVRL